MMDNWYAHFAKAKLIVNPVTAIISCIPDKYRLHIHNDMADNTLARQYFENLRSN